MTKAEIKNLLKNCADASEAEHRSYQSAERYGNAAYYQGKRDAFREAIIALDRLDDSDNAQQQLDALRAALADLAEPAPAADGKFVYLVDPNAKGAN